MLGAAPGPWRSLQSVSAAPLQCLASRSNHTALAKKFAQIDPQLFFENCLRAFREKIGFQELKEFEVGVAFSYYGIS